MREDRVMQCALLCSSRTAELAATKGRWLSSIGDRKANTRGLMNQGPTGAAVGVIGG
jgi:hypothetical protein